MGESAMPINRSSVEHRRTERGLPGWKPSPKPSMEHGLLPTSSDFPRPKFPGFSTALARRRVASPACFSFFFFFFSQRLWSSFRFTDLSRRITSGFPGVFQKFPLKLLPRVEERRGGQEGRRGGDRNDARHVFPADERRDSNEIGPRVTRSRTPTMMVFVPLLASLHPFFDCLTGKRIDWSLDNSFTIDGHVSSISRFGAPSLDKDEDPVFANERGTGLCIEPERSNFFGITIVESSRTIEGRFSITRCGSSRRIVEKELRIAPRVPRVDSLSSHRVPFNNYVPFTGTAPVIFTLKVYTNKYIIHSTLL